MNFKKTTKIILGFIILAVIVIYGIFVIEKQKTPGNLLKILPEKVDLQIKDARYTDVSESGMKWEITADTARYIKKENVAVFDKIAAKLITREGKTFLLTGDQGYLNTDTKDMKVSGNVKIVSHNGDSFRTDCLDYSNKEQKFQTEASVKMENRLLTITGKGMVLSLTDEKLALISDVKAEIRYNEQTVF
ncbi:MAG: LPS export ABC transporter periplasmic protein LptC [Deltaproteobacteria bacterium]|nr:LPS export ABC transporter periplasmic protein LptC [Deltaproteobacteria bacterium]